MQKFDEEHAEGLDGAGDEEVDDEGGEQDHPAPSTVRRDHFRPPCLPPRRHGFSYRGPVRFSAANVSMGTALRVDCNRYFLPSVAAKVRERSLSLLKDISAWSVVLGAITFFHNSAR